MTNQHDTSSKPVTSAPTANVGAKAAGFLLVVISLAWILNLPMLVKVPLYNEQPLACAVGLSLAVTAFLLGDRARGPLRLAAYLAGCVLLAIMLTIAWRYPQLTILAVMRPLWLTLSAYALIAGLGFLVWRYVGLPIVLIVALFSLLALFGGPFGIPETPVNRWAIYMLTDPNALLGTPVRVAVEIVIPFVLFGELLRHSGGSDFLTRISFAIFGRYRGGSAKAAVGTSALFGTITGNAVSNVVSTGIMTIPLMKRAGLSASTASAVEAAASTGGQLLPPVMGAAAFVMADYIQVPYHDVIIAAALPAALYFGAIFLQVDRMAARADVREIDKGERMTFRAAFAEGGHFALPFIVMFFVLFNLQTRPQMAAIAAIIALVLVSVVRPYRGVRLSPRIMLRVVVDTGMSVAPLLLITAAAGLIIGLISLTGLGFSIAGQAIALSGGHKIVLLILVALIAILFGMGMPTVAVYVVLATILAPALQDTGLEPMQAHLFILYFGMMSMLTPPVALASITAARIGGANMWRTSFEALKLAWVAYLVPFLFAFSPELLLGGTWYGATLAALTAFGGIAAVSMGAAGYARSALKPPMRFVYVFAGLCLMLPPALGHAVAILNIIAAIVLIALLATSPSRGTASETRQKDRSVRS